MADVDIELSIVMPCLNEAETLETCIRKAQGYLERSGVVGEVLIADNGSTDGSQDIARGLGARVVDVAEKGYGSALRGGIQAARGTFVIMGDADDSYDFTALDPSVERLRAGDDLVMGNRFLGGIEPGAMPPLHRYLGNPVLSFIGRLLFPSAIGDFHCGLRGFRRDSILGIGQITTGMEFASEMVVKATLDGLKVSEVPTTLKPDGRSRPPHLRSWRDGWRHLRFLLLYSPRWLFLLPGLVAFFAGVVGVGLLAMRPITVTEGVGLGLATQVYLSGLAAMGYQAILFAVLVKLYAQEEGYTLPRTRRFDRFAAAISLERGIVIGTILLVVGLIVGIIQVVAWGDSSFGAQDVIMTTRLAVPAALVMTIGVQTIMSSMFYGILRIPVAARLG